VASHFKRAFFLSSLKVSSKVNLGKKNKTVFWEGHNTTIDYFFNLFIFSKVASTM
jgi:hypothetical protein